MKITDTETTYTVEFPTPVVVDMNGDSYEVTTTRIVVMDGEDGDLYHEFTTKGYKLTNSGERSKAAPHPMRIYGADIDTLTTRAWFVVEAKIRDDKKETQ